MYKCEHFCIQELVPPKVYTKLGDQAWELLDNRLLLALDSLRNRYGRITINNWQWGGERLWSGLRTHGSPYYRPYSQHTFGRAADCVFNDISSEEVRQDILANPDDADFKLINSVELDVSWLHFDVRNCERIMTY